MEIVTREEWGAQHGRGDLLDQRAQAVVIHHTAGRTLPVDADVEDEAALVRGIEDHHARGRGWSGIGYSWLVMPSGRVYEGRGWYRRGAHTGAGSWNVRALGVALAMDGTKAPPSEAAILAVRDLIEIGTDARTIARDATLHAHGDLMATECPGEHIRAVMDRMRPRPLVDRIPEPELREIRHSVLPRRHDQDEDGPPWRGWSWEWTRG